MSQNLLKIVGVIIAIIGVKLVASPSLHWYGFAGGVILIGFGWGVYDMGRSK